MDGVITAPTSKYNSATRYINVDYPPSSGIKIFTKESFYGNLNAGAIIVIENNLLENASDGFGLVTWDDLAKIYGNLPFILNAMKNQMSGNMVGVKNDIDSTPGPGQYIDARYCWWGNETGPSGGALDVTTGLAANGSGDAVSYNVAWGLWRENPYGIPSPDWQVTPEYQPNAQGLTRDIIAGVHRNGNLASESAQSSVGFNPSLGPLIIWHRIGGVTPNQAAQGIGGDACRTGQIAHKYENLKIKKC